MEIIVYILPFLVSIFLFIFYRKETVWWEYLLLIVPSVLLVLLVEFGMKKINVRDTEYLGYYVTKISHYDRWNEYIHRTCTRQVPAGTDSKGHTKYRTETYDCSYVQNHPERWTYTLNNGNEIYFYNKEEFDRVKNRLQAPMKFIDMHRHYHTIDGDKQDYEFDMKREHIYTMTVEHAYDNYVKSSHSIFKTKEISKRRAGNLGLYEYPEIINYDQSGIIGITPDRKSDEAVRYLNGYFGLNHQFRLYILVYNDRQVDIADKQRAYWRGPNKNELVVCIGYSTQRNKINWCEAYSWEDEPVLAVKSKNYFLSADSLDITGYCDYIKGYVKTCWKRKNFSDFEYLKIDLSDKQVSWLFTLVLIYNILISFYIVRNDERN